MGDNQRPKDEAEAGAEPAAIKQSGSEDIEDKGAKSSKKGKKKKKKLTRKQRREKLKRQREKETESKIDTTDKRFDSLFTSPEFSIDPTHPQYSKVKGVSEILEERRKRRKKE